MRVLVLEPGYCPYIAFFDSAEEAVKKIIQGEKNVALPFGNEVIALVSSEEQDLCPSTAPLMSPPTSMAAP